MRKPDKARAQFASEVKELYTSTIAGKPPQREYEREVRQAAYGLVALRQASDHWFTKFEQDLDLTRLPSSGVSEARAIVDALTTGFDHPIWRHIEGLQTAEHRPNRAPKAASEQMRQSIAGGLVLALQEIVVTERKAADAIVAGISSPDFLSRPASFAHGRSWPMRRNTHSKLRQWRATLTARKLQRNAF